jgi:hypothetical protein
LKGILHDVKTANKNRHHLLLGVAGLVVAAGVMRAFWGTASRPEPSAAGYYTGPMKAKGGTTYGTEDGRLVAPPPTEVAADATGTAPQPQRTNK